MSTTNDQITFKGNQVSIKGEALKVGEKAPDFTLTGVSMNDVTLKDFEGKCLIISAVPSLDTEVCSIQTQRFNHEAASLGAIASVLTVSMDLPFAQKRWCGDKDAKDVTVASDYKERKFAEGYGLFIEDLHLLARAVFVLDKNHTVKHVEYVSEVTNEPDYDAALSALASLSLKTNNL
jgi:thiol peroxidase